jgi:hypothetical protein
MLAGSFPENPTGRKSGPAKDEGVEEICGIHYRPQFRSTATTRITATGTRVTTTPSATPRSGADDAEI